MSRVRELATYVESRQERLLTLLQDLVQIPSENRAPEGAEGACQEYVARVLRRAGWEPSLYSLAGAAGIETHPLYWPGRNYEGRPNLAAVRKGTGGGRSLILSGHVDTVPVGSAPWTRPPFGGQREGNRLYGRGANDMKAGIAANLFVAEALSELGIRLAGDLTFESVVDEEFGGVNGTLAGRLMGYSADAAIISEPSFLRVCPAQRGGRTVQISFQAVNEGILSNARTTLVIDQLRAFLDALPEFAALRRRLAPRHLSYAHLQDAVPVTVTRIQTAPWGTSEPTNVPETCRLELFWQTMPGEGLDEVDAQFAGWLEGLYERRGELFRERPEVVHPIRWLPGSAIEAKCPIVSELASVAESTLGFRPEIVGIEGPCDLYVFHEFGIPAALWGARGGNTHMPDEYVELDSLVQATKALMAFVCSWCGEEIR